MLFRIIQCTDLMYWNNSMNEMQIYATIESGSIAIAASRLDLLLDLMAGGRLCFTSAIGMVFSIMIGATVAKLVLRLYCKSSGNKRRGSLFWCGNKCTRIDCSYSWWYILLVDWPCWRHSLSCLHNIKLVWNRQGKCRYLLQPSYWSSILVS